MAGTPFKDGPAYIANAAADLYVPSANTYALVRHIHIANDDSSAVTVSLYVGATGGSAAGTQLAGGYSIAANDNFDIYFPAGLKLTSSDYLSGVASAASALSCTITGELYAA